MAVEQEISGIPSVHNIGALSLETMPLKSSLRSEAASWKAQFAQNLHKQCSEDLKAFDAYIRCVVVCVCVVGCCACCAEGCSVCCVLGTVVAPCSCWMMRAKQRHLPPIPTANHDPPHTHTHSAGIPRSN